MFKIIRNAWAIPELRKKILYTLLIIIIFRIGAAVPVPFLDAEALKASIASLTTNDSNTLVSYLNILSGGAFENATLFAMSVTPYINSSIIMQLLAVAIPALEKLSKEGEEGRKKLAQITRYATVILGVIQGTAYYFYLRNSGNILTRFDSKVENIYVAVVIIATFTAGSAMMMWLGEQINQKGIGNGISILLFAGIVSRGPSAASTLFRWFSEAIKAINNGTATAESTKYLFFVPLIVIFYIVVVGFIVFMNSAERRIPVQYAKRVVGRRMYGGQSTHIPIKVNMSGVLPIIFASSIIAIPSTLKLFIYGNETSTKFWYKVLDVFNSSRFLYVAVYFVLIILFAYFYVTIQYNPTEMANNLRKNSGAVPGIRPGKPTADFIQKIISRITLIGALFLSVVAILPILIGAITNIPIGMSGTSILILVGVALETVQQIESQMLMRHYKGFLE